MLNICTVCKEEFEDDAQELTDNDMCPACYDSIYREMLERGDDPMLPGIDLTAGEVDFTFEDLD